MREAKKLGLDILFVAMPYGKGVYERLRYWTGGCLCRTITCMEVQGIVGRITWCWSRKLVERWNNSFLYENGSRPLRSCYALLACICDR